MPTQRIFSAALLTAIALMIASLYFTSPYQVWLLLAGVGAVTGIAYRTGQRHVVTGFGIGIAMTLVREALMYGPQMIEITGLVYAAGYLFAVATTISMRTLIIKLKKEPVRA
jgi:hypothetical protein